MSLLCQVVFLTIPNISFNIEALKRYFNNPHSFKNNLNLISAFVSLINFLFGFFIPATSYYNRRKKWGNLTGIFRKLNRWRIY